MSGQAVSYLFIWIKLEHTKLSKFRLKTSFHHCTPYSLQLYNRFYEMSLPNFPITIVSLPTEIEWRYTEKGERVRVSVRSGRIIPLPGGCPRVGRFR